MKLWGGGLILDMRRVEFKRGTLACDSGGVGAVSVGGTGRRVFVVGVLEGVHWGTTTGVHRVSVPRRGHAVALPLRLLRVLSHPGVRVDARLPLQSRFRTVIIPPCNHNRPTHQHFNKTRRESPKPAPYLRLKNIQGTTIGKNYFFQKRYFKKSQTMPKNSKRGHLGSLNVFTNFEKCKGVPFDRIRKFFEIKSPSADKKTKRKHKKIVV